MTEIETCTFIKPKKVRGNLRKKEVLGLEDDETSVAKKPKLLGGMVVSSKKEKVKDIFFSNPLVR